MARINLESARLPSASQDLLVQVQRTFGMTPNMFTVVGNSPAALKAMWGFFGALGSGTLDKGLTEQIAITIANRNGCEYCLAAHTALGTQAGVSAQALAQAKTGASQDARTAAALRFALKMVNERAHIGDSDIRNLRDAGYDDGQIVEIVAHVALNLFTNYLNVAFNVPVDFPHVALAA